ncbi:hypothetical protein TPHA_0J00330 [Tetrapisispora phaffii CBS 4417]|uniref:VPS9 domain-containing protein n=1 Tax=Tetrapisispora phaffii (strain ATCC 24235 / CBS 4417 / NBRC 1672 / NRRL Y-8282 / UCD 70-5) TaxID=1071381 RepID=G8BYB4_TETPH|nr:hypothetical protein TPHA_0J00330 [Tetrapisispora phaffii CBS 4417]CCE64856.1 hypothetical protein TPHA_0J00330 [Tetrapisispora phaffii CBS 4417]
MAYFMPVLKNPLINAVFNCPDPHASPFKKLYNELRDKDFLLLVPNDFILLYYKDSTSNISFRELCYTYDFVAAHILILDKNSSTDKISSSNQKNGDVYLKSLNGKEVLLRQSLCIPIKGYFSKRKSQMRDATLLTNFNDYLHGSGHFGIMHIDYPLGVSDWTLIDELKGFEESRELPFHSQDKDKPGLLQRTEENKADRVKFIQLFQERKDWTIELEKYLKKYQAMEPLQNIGSELFHDIVNMIYNTLKEEQRFQRFTNLYDIAYEYIESLLYQDIWNKLQEHYRDKILDFRLVSQLSLDMLDTTFYNRTFKNFQLIDIVNMEACMVQAVSVFKGIKSANSYSKKVDVIFKTLNIITGKNSDDTIRDNTLPKLPLIDADTLVSLFALLLCRAGVEDVFLHVQYLQSFYKDENTVKFGALGYTLSTIEATLSYFYELSNSDESRIQLQKLSLLEDFLIKIRSQHDDLIPINQFKDYFRYRTQYGESILSLLIANKKNEALCEALLNFEDIFPLDDLLYDTDVSGSTLLIKCLKERNLEAAEILIEIFQNSCTNSELLNYYNKTDKTKRTLAHYITDEIEILEKIGKYINWTLKDLKGRTALFTIFRSYDQTTYSSTIKIALDQALLWYKNNDIIFKVSDHTDLFGDSLLHILKSQVSLLLKFEDLDINIPNLKGMTPLMTYVKYNRIDNIKTILEDGRLIIKKLQKDKYLNCLDYGKNFTVFNLLAAKLSKDVIFENAYISYARYEKSHWYLCISVQKDDLEYTTNIIKLKKYYNLINAMQKIYKSDFIPYSDMLDCLKKIIEGHNILPIRRLKIKNYLNFLSHGLSALLYFEKIDPLTLLDENLIIKWISSKLQQQEKSIDDHSSFKPLSAEDINNIKAFCDFSFQEIGKTNNVIQSFLKLSIFGEIKNTDLNTSYDILERLGSYFSNNEISRTLGDLQSISPHVHSSMVYYELSQDILFMKKCTLILTSKLASFIKDKLSIWLKKNTKLLEHRKEYSIKFLQSNEETGNLSENTSVFRYAWNVTYRKEEERRLKFAMLELERDLKKLGTEIRVKHEELAEEFSDYVRMKSKFNSNLLVRKFVSLNLAHLKEQSNLVQRIAMKLNTK